MAFPAKLFPDTFLALLPEDVMNNIMTKAANPNADAEDGLVYNICLHCKSRTAQMHAFEQWLEGDYLGDMYFCDNCLQHVALYDNKECWEQIAKLHPKKNYRGQNVISYD